MIITIKNGADEKQLNKLVDWIARQGASADVETAGGKLLVGILSGVENIDEELLKSMDIVEKVTRVTEKYKLTNRKFHPEDTVVTAGGKKIGGENYTFIAGPCSVESEKQIIGIAKAVKKAGAAILRGGAFKPRTSPYDFQGLGEDGLKILASVGKKVGIKTVSEITDVRLLSKYADIDILQVGARNMQNFALLKELGKTDKPVIIKRGFVNTAEELLLSAEYVLSGGNERVAICERGIRTFENSTRFTLDLCSVAALKLKSELAIIVDPSHAAGDCKIVKSLALAAVAAGADGIMTEVHTHPENALCDGAQAISPEVFGEIVKAGKAIKKII